MTPPNPDQLDPDWHRYPDTVLHFHAEPVVSVDLREPAGNETRSAMDRLGLAGPFAVMTAHDPRGRDESAEVNARRAKELDRRLAALGVPFVHVDACSPDRSHCEASVAAVMDREAATALARELEQVAMFWYDGDKFWIVGALVGGDPVM
ncbi:MAG TPA: DUF3293 domain-containing protein, partial [Gemmatimonadaceae bacterium]|nr:DUF3293 domain-containing protein [Gemmatimonadaceae bacterium]